MFVEKIFSEVETGENLYSVLMDEDEVALFSDFQERYYSWKDALIKAGRKLAETPEAQSIANHINMVGKRAAVSGAQAVKNGLTGLFDAYGRSFEPIGKDVNGLIKKGANKLTKSVTKSAKTAAKTYETGSDILKNTKTSKVARELGMTN